MKIFEKEKVKNFYKIAMTPSISILPGNLAFYLVMSLVPIITLIAGICSKFSLSTADLATLFDAILPKNVEEILLSIFHDAGNTTFNIWFIILGFFLASNGSHAIIIASNNLYEIDNKPYIQRRIKALLLTIFLTILFTFILFVLAFGNMILEFVLSLKIFVNVKDLVFSLFLTLKWPIAIIVIFILIKVIYTIAPDRKIRRNSVNSGSIFSTLGIVLATSIYGYYVNYIANYNYIYGNLANIIVLMILVYVISYIIVLGIAINANGYHFMKKDK